MDKLDYLIEQNKRWAADKKARDAEFFSRLCKQQAPKLLWIGCSDSRVPANQITGLPPGEIFVHRNIANLVIHTDLNCLSVIHYAVAVLKVEHIIVCGHYGCGGIAAALEDKHHGLIDNWLNHIKEVCRLHARTVEQTPQPQRADVLCELNVKEQLKNVAASSIVKNAWQQGQELTLHGWIYSIRDGILHKLARMDKP